MIISNYRNKYIKLESGYIDDMIANPANYSALRITTKTDCNTTELVKTITSSTLNNAGWVIDLSEAVALDNKVYRVYVKNLFSLKEYNVITTPIDLAYVKATCTGNTACTLQTFQAYFAPLFKSQIDTWFSSKSITSNVTVTFTGNKMTITNVPVNFGFSRVFHDFENVAPYKELPFGYAGSDSAVIIAPNFVYLTPEFFSDTSLKDGVYEVTLRFIKANNGGYVEETMCAFLDVTLRCRVAANVAVFSNVGNNEEAQKVLLLHYALRNASNCDCNCNDLCKLYNELLPLLTIINPTEDCGCN